MNISEENAIAISQEAPAATERPSATDALLYQYVLAPLVAKIPSTVKPNSVTLCTPVVASTSFALAALAPFIAPVPALFARLGAGLFMFASMLTDHLDGLHARRTKQTSKLGEALDHWLDAYHVPLATAGLVYTLQMPWWIGGCLVLGAGMIYNAQLVLYQHSGKFVHAPTGGASAQVMLALGYAALGVVLYIFPRDLSWMNAAVLAFAAAVFVSTLRQVGFYWRRLGVAVVPHVFYLLKSSALIYLLAAEKIAPHVGIALLLVLSFRLSGMLVLRIVRRRTFPGYDPVLGVGVFILLILASLPSHPIWQTWTLVDFLGAALCAGSMGQNVWAFLQTKRELVRLQPGMR